MRVSGNNLVRCTGEYREIIIIEEKGEKTNGRGKEMRNL